MTGTWAGAAVIAVVVTVVVGRRAVRGWRDAGRRLDEMLSHPSMRARSIVGLLPDCACDQAQGRPGWTHTTDACHPPPCQCRGHLHDLSGVVHAPQLCQPWRETVRGGSA